MAKWCLKRGWAMGERREKQIGISFLGSFKILPGEIPNFHFILIRTTPFSPANLIFTEVISKLANK